MGLREGAREADYYIIIYYINKYIENECPDFFSWNACLPSTGPAEGGLAEAPRVEEEGEEEVDWEGWKRKRGQQTET